MDRRIPLAIGAGLTLVLAAVVYCWRAKATHTPTQYVPCVIIFSQLTPIDLSIITYLSYYLTSYLILAYPTT